MKEIVLTKGFFALVDDHAFEYLNQWRWHVVPSGNTFYASRGRDNVLMHRVILGLSDPSVFCDHIDRNGLNNLRDNLRVATRYQNNCNKIAKGTSKYLGVCWHKHKKRWTAQITKDYKPKCIGYFKNEIDAALAYNSAAKRVHGEFANLNNIETANV